MENKNKSGKLRNTGTYFKKGLKFYELKNEALARYIFLVILLTGLVEFIIPENVYMQSVFGVIRLTIVHIASTIYLSAYLKELKGEDEMGNTKACIKQVLGNIIRVMFSSVSYILSVVMLLGMFLAPLAAGYVVTVLTIPVFLLYLIYFFNVCYIVDKKMGIAESYKASRKITKGIKGRIFMVVFTIYFVLSIPLSFILLPMYFSNSSIANAFVILFVSSIINIIQQRITALMYVDLEYGKEDNETVVM